MEFWEYIILFLSVVIGGGVAFFVKNYNPSILQMLLSFVGAYVLGITVLHLLPGVYHEPDHFIGLWILGGFFIQILLELLSGGVEHGHIHPTHQPKTSFAIQILLGLCIHAFIEGMPLETYDAFQQEVFEHGHNHQHLLYGIILHKLPAAFVLVMLLTLSKFKKTFIIGALIVFGLMSPLGALSTGLLASNGILDSENTKILLAIVVGSFLHISTTILFETESGGHHHISMKKIVMILIGLMFALFTVIF
jgi:zinc and cadmium transporter